MKISKIKFLIILFLLWFSTSVNAQELKSIFCYNDALYELKADDITQNSLILEWFSIADVNEYVIVYGLKGFDIKDKRSRLGKIRTNQTIEFFTNLQPGTSYDFYVKLKCQKRSFYKKLSIQTLYPIKKRRKRSARLSSRMARSSNLANELAKEKQALWELYQSTNGPQWKNTLANKKPWALDKPVSDWNGVVVDNEGYVLGIQLDNNNLKGTIPSSIGILSRIKSLILRNNLLTSLPSTIGKLRRLKILNINTNELRILPNTFHELKALKFLSVSHNKLEMLPTSIGSLSSLRSLSLEKNSLKILPKEIGDLNRLTSLNLASNSLNSLPREFENLTLLTSLILDTNHFTNMPLWLGKLSRLRYLNFGNNQIEEVSKEILGLKNIQIIHLENNKISKLPNELWNFPKLRSLSLSGNRITNIPFSVNLPSLTNLAISRNEISGSLSQINFAGLPELIHLSVEKNKLSGAIPSSIGKLTKLSHLGLADNQLSGTLEVVFQNLKSIKTIYLVNNNLTGKIPNKKGMRIFTIQGNKFIFSDFEKTRYGGTMRYHPQQKIDKREIKEVSLGDTVTLTTSTLTDSDNRYQWYKNGAPIKGATNKKLVISNIDQSDIGGYYFEAKNYVAPKLTLERHPIILKLTETSCKVSEEEKNALWSFYTSTNGANWKNTVSGNKPWSLAIPVCDWYGVKLDQEGHVVHLQLTRNNLNGRIPSSISSLKRLTYIHLANNKISSVSPEMGLLKNVKELNLSNNLLESLPDQFFDMTGLVKLLLFSNKITELNKGIKKLKKLKTLSMMDNQLSKLPIETGDLSALEYLFLSQNKLQGAFPQCILSLTNLKSLVMNNNNLSGPIPEGISNLSKLENLSVTNNKFSSLPASLGELGQLEYFYAMKNEIEGTLTHINFKGLQNLVLFQVGYNKLRGLFPIDFKLKHKRRGVSGPNLIINTNHFVFKDLENIFLKQEYKSYKYFKYAPQAKVDAIEDRVVQIGKTITLSSTALTSPNNSYQWYKDGVLIYEGPNKDLVLENVTESAAGVYHFTATNSIVPELTLERHPITVKVQTGAVITPVSMTVIEQTRSGSFRPGYEKKYMISGWVKERNVSGIKSSNYTSSAIRLYTVGLASGSLEEPVFIGDFYPSGNIIDGWQRIEGVFKINTYQSSDQTAVNNLVIELKNNSDDVTSYFDDIRIYPFNGSMKSFVYDDDTKKLMAELDENNYATYYEYDKEGGLVRVKKETKKGIFTIQETRSSNAK